MNTSFTSLYDKSSVCLFCISELLGRNSRRYISSRDRLQFVGHLAPLDLCARASTDFEGVTDRVFNRRQSALRQFLARGVGHVEDVERQVLFSSDLGENYVQVERRKSVCDFVRQPEPVARSQFE